MLLRDVLRDELDDLADMGDPETTDEYEPTDDELDNMDYLMAKELSERTDREPQKEANKEAQKN